MLATTHFSMLPEFSVPRGAPASTFRQDDTEGATTRVRTPATGRTAVAPHLRREHHRISCPIVLKACTDILGDGTHRNVYVPLEDQYREQLCRSRLAVECIARFRCLENFTQKRASPSLMSGLRCVFEALFILVCEEIYRKTSADAKTSEE